MNSIGKYRLTGQLLTTLTRFFLQTAHPGRGVIDPRN